MIQNNPMLDGLSNATNKAYTANGALVRENTNSSVLDFFSKGGALRTNVKGSVQLFDAALSENALLAVRAMFYFRDIRGGQGERDCFRAQLSHLLSKSPDTVYKNLHLVSEYGRWDDLLTLIDTKAGEAVVTLIKNQLLTDVQSMKDNESISLLAKWMPTENAGVQSNMLSHKLAKRMKLSARNYRKIMSSLRENLNIVERKMSRKQWSDIDYNTVASRSMMVYRRAFERNDEKGFTEFLDNVEKGEAKINAATLYPYEIVSKCQKWGYGGTSENPQLLDAQWNALPDYVSGDGSGENSIAVVDTSGSMSGQPIDVAISLGIYLGERATGAYKDHFITFSSQPKLQKITGTGIVEKVANLSRAQWNQSTNIEAVFDLVLNVAIEKKLTQDELIQKIYIISDMQFNSCISADKTLFQHIGQKFASYGYTMPQLVFWNVRATMGNTPMSLDDRGFQNVSGLSPSIFQYLMGGEFKGAYELMEDVLNSERYQAVVL